MMMMENYVQSVKISHNPDWPYIPDHLYRIESLVSQDQARLISYGA